MSKEYEEYLKSERWKKTRAAALSRAGDACQVCAGTMRLEVHHRTYVRLGHELPMDLTVLCRNCHKLYHTRLRTPMGAIPIVRSLEPRPNLERVLLGVLVSHPQFVEQVAAELSADHFRDPSYRMLFLDICDEPTGRAVSPVMNELRQELASGPSPAHAEEVVVRVVPRLRIEAIQRRTAELRDQIKSSDNEGEKIELMAVISRLAAEIRDINDAMRAAL